MTHTQQTDEWGPWIEHDGKGFPVPVGTIVQRYLDPPAGIINGTICDPPVCVHTGAVGEQELMSWRYAKDPSIWEGFQIARVIRYRVRQFRAMSSLKRTAMLPDRIAEAAQ